MYVRDVAIFALVFCVVTFIVYIWFVVKIVKRHQRESRRSALCDQLVAEGVYDHAEYTKYQTVIHFNDSRTCVLPNHRDITFPKGTSIKIFGNGSEVYKIEKTQ